MKPVLLSRICLSLIFMLGLSLNVAEARWASQADAPVVYRRYDSHIQVDKSGASEETVHLEMQIQNERGRALYATQSFQYNGQVQTVEILSAETQNGDQMIPVPKETIEIKPLASSEQGFDQLYQVLIAYPKVVTGSTIRLSYKLITKQQPILGYFAERFDLGRGGYFENAQITIDSALPLFCSVQDPAGHLSVQQKKVKERYHLQLQLKRPLYQDMVNEESLFDPKAAVFVSVSSLQQVEEIAKALAPDYEAVATSPLPPLLSGMVERVAGLSDQPTQQINTLIADLIQEVRYMGDWQSIDGKFKPRPLAKVAETGVADCKDYASSLVAMLRQLGYRAHVALVYRGEPYLPSQQEQARLGLFNHAMVYAQDKAGKTYWLDPTNFVSMAQGLFPDISGRPALVLDPAKPLYTDIPWNLAEENQLDSQKTWTLSTDGQLKTEGTLSLKGLAAMKLTGAGLRLSEQAIQEVLVSILSGEKKPLQYAMQLPDLKSRLVKDLVLQYQFAQEDVALVTNLGQGLDLSRSWVNTFINQAEDQVGVVYLGQPKMETQTLFLPGQKAKQLSHLNASIDTPWLAFRRRLHPQETGILIEELVIFKKPFLYPAELRSADFLKFKKALKQAVNGAVLVLE